MGALAFVMCVMRHTVTSRLTQHKCTRTDERPYICDVFNKVYSQKSNLITHERKHSGELPYVCDVCNMAYSDEKSDNA